jgi:hypothetical protein
MSFKRAAVAVCAILLFVGSASASEQLVTELKQLGQAADNLSVHISKATSDADAATIAGAVQQTFAANLNWNPKPQVAVTASAGKCEILITSPGWRLWSRAENGQLVDHGANIH